jgi:hypothetical protein
MAEKIINGQHNYLYFASQNFRGSLEAYIIVPFQYFFGINIFTLRVNNLIFNTLSAVFVYLTTFKLITNKSRGAHVFSFFSAVLYLLLLPENLVIHTKAWGNYSFIEFTAIFSLYIFTFNIFSLKNLNFKWLVFLGLTLAVSFWANMQSLYFIFVIILFSLIKDVQLLNKAGFKSFIKNKIYFLVVALNLTFAVVNLYFLYKKKSIFNPAITLNQKIGFNLSQNILNNFNIYYINIIYFMFLLFGIYVLYSYLSKKYYFTNFLYLVNFSFLGIAINIYHNSLNRVSAGGGSILSVVTFLHKVVFTSFYGVYYLMFFIPVAFYIFFLLYCRIFIFCVSTKAVINSQKI